MDTFIKKNILLDEIIEINEYISSYPDTRDSIYFVELLSIIIIFHILFLFNYNILKIYLII